MRSKQIEEYKRTLKLTVVQREVLIGVILGDACLESSNGGKTYRLKFEQSPEHQAYILHLYSQFEDWVLTPPRARPRSIRIDGLANWTFQTVSHAALRFYGQQFYGQGRKKVPKQIKRWLTPRGLAYWFMDDGSIKSAESKGVILNTQGFERSDVERLCEVLGSKFGLQASVRFQRDGCQIYVSGHSYEQISSLMEPFMIDEMKYKLPKPRRTQLPKK